MIPASIFEQTLLGFFAPIRPYLDDPTISEVMINGPKKVYIERDGKILPTTAQFESHDDLMSALRNLAQFVGRPIGPEHPILEARLPDGSRVEAIMPPAACDGPNVSIRRFYSQLLTADRLVTLGAVSRDAMATLELLVAARQNLIAAGGTASGKTSLLNALSASIAPDERVVVIEDARELQLKQPHVLQLEAQPADARGRGQVTVRELFRATLRMRPDRIVVGEVRGGEALDLIQAMTSGHGGCLSTVHATHPRDTLNRIETMALMSDVDLPLMALRAQVASAIGFVVHTARLSDGSRCVTQIAEVVGHNGDAGYETRDLFARHYDAAAPGDDSGGEARVRSRLEPTGLLPTCLENLHCSGYRLPEAVYQAARRRGDVDAQ